MGKCGSPFRQWKAWPCGQSIKIRGVKEATVSVEAESDGSGLRWKRQQPGFGTFPS